MASALFGEFSSRLSLAGIDIDNWTFKFYSRVSVVILLVASAASILETYGGTPITCKGGESYDDAYCWLHGTSHLPKNKVAQEINNGDYCFDPSSLSDTDDSDDSATDTKYYIWVSMILFLSAALFIIPDQLWKHFEGGMIEQFGSNRREFLGDTEKHAATFKNLSKNQTKRYFFTFIFFECLNFAICIVNFVLIDKFLSGKFSSYGSKTIQYYAGTLEKTEIEYGEHENKAIMINPMCSVFPTIVNCDFKTFSVNNGPPDTRSNICILGQNIMNQQIFLILWFWFVVLFIASALMVIYRLVTLSLVDIQRTTIQCYVKSKDVDAVKALKLDFDHIGNWFILTQIGRNATPYTFRKFLNEVAGKRKSVNSEEEKEKKQKTNSENGLKSSPSTEKLTGNENELKSSSSTEKLTGNDYELSIMETT